MATLVYFPQNILYNWYMNKAEYMREWVKTHPEYRQYQKEYGKKYYQEHKLEHAANRKIWYQKNKERVIKMEHDRYHANKVLKGKAKGEKIANWKGDSVGYQALHAWVWRWKGKADHCEQCGSTENSRYFWANKSREYKRDLDDWIQLCGKCHFKYDEQHLRLHDKGRLV